MGSHRWWLFPLILGTCSHPRGHLKLQAGPNPGYAWRAFTLALCGISSACLNGHYSCIWTSK